MIDAMYILGNRSYWGDLELLFSLRALEENIHNLRDVYLVGRRPDWITGVIHIPAGDRHTCKERNIMEKMARGCGHPELSDRFISMHDDHFALAVQDGERIPNYAGSLLGELSGRVKSGNHWRDAVANTSRVLTARGLPELNYDLHYPMIIEKIEFPRIMDAYDWSEPRGYVVKSLYANTAGLEPTRTTDLKLNTYLQLEEIVGYLSGRPWFSLGDGAINSQMRNLLTALWPNPSRFELANI